MRHPNIKQIRQAIMANRGGHENTTDAGILRLWLMLSEETREVYLASIKPHVEKPRMETKDDEPVST